MQFILTTTQAKALAALSLSASTDLTRPLLCTVRFEWDGATLEVVATDSYQLTMRRIDMTAVSSGWSADQPKGAVTVDAKSFAEAVAAAVKAAPKANPRVVFAATDEEGLDIGDIIATSTTSLRHVEGTYPKWRQLGIDPDTGAAENTDTMPALDPLYLARMIRAAGPLTPSKAKTKNKARAEALGLRSFAKPGSSSDRAPFGWVRTDDLGRLASALMPIYPSPA